MKREIKFRAWDKSDKVMREVYGLLYPKISNKGNRDKFIVNLHCSDYEKQKAIMLSDFERFIDEVELMQYTGLKDKNGKEIYESDIVRTVVKTEYGKENVDEEVYFGGGAFYPVSTQPDETWEIIGNIYQK